MILVSEILRKFHTKILQICLPHLSDVAKSGQICKAFVSNFLRI